jgi:hypothetical protein
MRATYGATFDRQWEAPEGIDPAEHVRQIRAMWRRTLEPTLATRSAGHALDNQPPFPPNLIEFRDICGRSRCLGPVARRARA